MSTQQQQYEMISPQAPVLRVALMGAPGTGKTTSALTFPNPRLLTKDNKQPPGVKIVPFFRPEVEKMFSDNDISRSGPRSALINFLLRESSKRVGPEHTEVIDSWTAWMNDFEIWAEKVKHILFMTKGGKDRQPEFDGFKLHSERLNMCIEIMAATRALQCNLVINIHEQIERNEQGVPIGIRPMTRGQFSDQFAAHVTAFFRQVKLSSKDGNEQYLWQVVGDNAFPHVIRPPGMDLSKVELIQGKYIKADYQTLLKTLMP